MVNRGPMFLFFRCLRSISLKICLWSFDRKTRLARLREISGKVGLIYKSFGVNRLLDPSSIGGVDISLRCTPWVRQFVI